MNLSSTVAASNRGPRQAGQHAQTSSAGGSLVEINDVRDALKRALASDLDFKGSYYYEATHLPAVNPILRLKDAGRVGLPLTEQAAKRVISHCRQAPFGQGERTVIDTSVRDTWEMDAADVHFDNPEWSSFMDGVVRSACSALGVDVGLSKPRCDLYKLLLYETGSHFLPHQDTEKADGMFATVVVILQSPYTGGEAHLAHGGLSTVIDHSKNSLLATSVMAWYTDVTHEIKPITSGYRLALSYNLVHTTTTLRPSIPGSHPAGQQLRNIFMSWKSQGYLGLQKIIYLLDHRYSRANLKGSALKGGDSHQIALLNVVAKECGFNVGLANIESHLSGSANDDGGGYDGRGYGRRCAYDDEDEEDDDDLSMVEVFETEWSITNLVDMDGDLITDTFYVADDSNETIPADLQKQVESGPVDEQEYEGYQGNGAGTLERWYRRTALVIWPESRHLEVVKGEEYPQYVLDSLLKLNPENSDDEEQHLIDYLFGLLAKGSGEVTSSQVAQAVCTAACTWGDEELWKRGAALFSDAVQISQLGVPAIAEAVQCFSLDVVLPKVALMLTNDLSNAARCGVLDALDLKADKANTVLRGWIAEQRSLVIRGLKPIAAADASPLVELSLKQGGMSAFKELVYPQVISTGRPAVMRAFARRLHQQKDKFGNDSPQVQALVTDLLSASISKTDYYELVQPQALPRQTPYYRPPPPEPTPSCAFLHIQSCLDSGNEALVETIIDTMVSMTGIATADAWKRATLVLLPLIPRLDPILRARPIDAPPVPGLAKLYSAAVTNALVQLPQQKITEKEIDALLNVASSVDGALDLLQNVIVPKIISHSADIGAFMHLARQLRAREPTLAFPAQSNTSVPTLVGDIVNAMLSRVHPATLSSPEVINYLAFLHEIGQQPHCAGILSRLVEEKALTTNHITTHLVPLIPELVTFLNGNSINLSSQPYSTLFKGAVLAWCRKVLGPKPPDVSPQINMVARTLSSCCHSCKPIGTFLHSSKQRDLRLDRVGAPNAKHMDTKMRSCCSPNIATWTIVMTSPRGFQVTKANAVWSIVQWNERAVQGKAILESISRSEATLRAIFGDQDYSHVLQNMSLPVPANILASVAKAPATAASNPVTGAPSKPPLPSTSATPSTVLQTPRRESTSSAGPATKKRKLDDKDVMFIDLTTP